MCNDRYENVVSLEGNACREVFFLHDWHGIHAALEYLVLWHAPGQHVIVDAPQVQRQDDSYQDEGYVVALNRYQRVATLWYRVPVSS